MKRFSKNIYGLAAGTLPLAMIPGTGWAAHEVHDIQGVSFPGNATPEFTFTAKSGYVSTAEGNSVYFWGYANGAGPAQYSGPTMIVKEGDVVKVTLNNELPVNTSIVFPGQTGVTTVGGADGVITKEAAPGGTVTYQFTASKPGTFLYESGTQPDLQTEMGLVGALIVRPAEYTWVWDPVAKTGTGNRYAYKHSDSAYEHEFLFFLTEMDENIHDTVEAQVKAGQTIAVDTTKRWPVYWFINGRTGPDTVLPPLVNPDGTPGAVWLPNQPYDALTLIHAGDTALMRVIGAGRDPHPFHHHGNHAKVIARDGRLLATVQPSLGVPGSGADLAYQVFTIPSTPGSTYDALFQWTGAKLGWDAYGHGHDINVAPLNDFPGPGDVDHNGNGVIDAVQLAIGEYAEDHGKPFPVKLPQDQDVTFGQMYSGSPFLGLSGALPPGEGGFNPVGGFMYMWHSHAEKELCNNNIFGGGMLTFLLIAAHPQ